jgi:hypothetical protein
MTQARTETTARAYDVRIDDIYQPAERPGCACWVNLWRAPNDDLMLI